MGIDVCDACGYVEPMIPEMCSCMFIVHIHCGGRCIVVVSPPLLLFSLFLYFLFFTQIAVSLCSRSELEL